MTQVLMFTSPYFRGTITDTPSGSAYHVVPGQTVVVQEADVALLQTFGFTAAAPPVPSEGTLTLSDTNSHTITNTSTIIVGSGGTVSGSGGVGTITGFGGGGGGGSYIEVESGSSTKISAMPTLANPPLAPVYDAVITNDGTTQTNYQRPQGVIVQPAATGTNSGLGILLTAAASSGEDGSVAGVVHANGGAITAPGTAVPAYGGANFWTGGNAISTDAAGRAHGGGVYGYAGNASNLIMNAVAGGAQIQQYGGLVDASTSLVMGGGVTIVPGHAIVAAGTTISAAYMSIGGGTAYGGTYAPGGIVIQPGMGATNGNLIIQNLGTADPHVLNAAWLGVSNGVTLSAG